MDCYRVMIPHGARVCGVTAGGEPSTVLPGEYLVHRLRLAAEAPAVLRFVGADALGRDVHVPLESAQRLAQSVVLAPSPHPDSA